MRDPSRMARIATFRAEHEFRNSNRGTAHLLCDLNSSWRSSTTTAGTPVSGASSTGLTSEIWALPGRLRRIRWAGGSPSPRPTIQGRFLLLPYRPCPRPARARSTSGAGPEPCLSLL
jgi:hypothetical protein